MIKKLSKHGNNLAILIDKPILELLNLNENSQFKMKVEEGKIILEPVRAITISEDAKLQKAYEELVEKYDTVFRKLAKN